MKLNRDLTSKDYKIIAISLIGIAVIVNVGVFFVKGHDWLRVAKINFALIPLIIILIPAFKGKSTKSIDKSFHNYLYPSSNSLLMTIIAFAVVIILLILGLVFLKVTGS